MKKNTMEPGNHGPASGCNDHYFFLLLSFWK